MGHWPTGVAVVTSWDMNNPVGCTVNAIMSVSLLPPLLLIALDAESTTLGVIRRTGEFSLNVLSADQRDLCQRFAHGSQQDRFDRLPYRRHLRLPLLADVAAATICTVTDTFACGDHELIVGAPVWFTARDDSSPLLFHRRGYHRLASASADLASDRQ
jgi:flavin reductase (DIM6/NTAB) family NADH-FMN oxidoreductase RutF